MRGKAILSLSSGVAAVVLTLVGVALMNPPRTADAAVMHGSLVAMPAGRSRDRLGVWRVEQGAASDVHPGSGEQQR